MNKQASFLDRDRYIVSADDYGLRSASAEILPLAEKGLLDRVAVMVDRVTQEDAEALAKTGVAIDIHLELTRLVGTGEKTEDGIISRGISFLSRLLFGCLSAREVGGEWERQLVRFEELFGRKPDGWNVHEHYHYFPLFFRVLAGFVEKHGDGFMRFGHKGIFSGRRRTPTSSILSLMRFFCQSAFVRHTAPTSEYMASFDWFAGREEELFEEEVHGVVELVFHPERPEERRWIEEHIRVKSPK
ncbi:MAG TPA: ChbG/HpnK family deacetylase [Candidatus Fimivivens sp.]|nr:ChbG/HpnK family deacetylase [Candidatus Fimivivens sp.]